MFFLFGWGRRTLKNYGATYAIRCSNCNNTQFWNLVHLRLWFTLFFIPVFPYESKHLLLCPVCQQGIKLSGQQVARAMKLNQYSLAFINKTLNKEQYFAQLSQLDPLAIEPSGASTGIPVVQAQEKPRAVPPPLPMQKAVQFSYYDDSGVVRTQVVRKALILLGSSGQCDLVLPLLAPEHCKIFSNGEGLYAEDLGGGININGKEGSGDIHDNDVLEAGSCSFRINFI